MHNDGITLGEGKPKLFIHQVSCLHPKVKRISKVENNDNLIISTALTIKELLDRKAKTKKPGRKLIPKKVIVLANDINLRNKARLLKLKAEKYINASVRGIDSIYSGKENILLSAELLSDLHENGSIPYEKVREYLGDETPEPISYEFFVVNGETYSYFFEDSLHLVKGYEKKLVCGCISARNTEQKLALSLLLNTEVEAVTMSGIAGTGKTLLAIGAALHQENLYEKIIITRPVIGLNGKEIGFLPGDEKEKVRPYMAPIFDNIDCIKGLLKKKGKSTEKLDALIKDESRFIIQPFTLIRGRSFPNAIIVVDEAQNLTTLDALAIMTRLGEGSKIILVGDPDQTDYSWMSRINNGLSYLIHNLKRYKHAGSLTLIKGERSRISEWASLNLS